jgi:hypothetical protein
VYQGCSAPSTTVLGVSSLYCLLSFVGSTSTAVVPEHKGMPTIGK